MLTEEFQIKVVCAAEAIESDGGMEFCLDADEVMSVIVEMANIIKMARRHQSSETHQVTNLN